MFRTKKTSTLVSAIPVTWAAVIFDGKPFSSIPESEVEDFKKWYPRGNWMPSKMQGNPFYRTGIPFITHNKRQSVIEVVFGKSDEMALPEIPTNIDISEFKSITVAANNHGRPPMIEDILTDAAKFHMEVNS